MLNIRSILALATSSEPLSNLTALALFVDVRAISPVMIGSRSRSFLL